MKFTQSFIPTLRQAPADAEVISHKLLVRAGLIRKVTSGIYEWLPLGLRALRKLEAIVRDELDRAGCQEVFMPHMVPAELWQESLRWQKYGKELLRIKDRHEREYCFGPTHEEVIVDMVRGLTTSYKNFPLNLYQIQTKFRDEIRPRFGLMRGREFLMKDGYSFHTSSEDLDREYQNMHQAYLNIFKRAGLECRAVDADTGAIGGSSSHEFMVLADTGEDTIAVCQPCQYAANLEKATRQYKKPTSALNADQNAIQEVLTPQKKSIEDVAQFLKITPDILAKTLIFKCDNQYAVIVLAGNRDVNDIKLGHVLKGDEVRLATESEVLALTGVPVGFLGPVGLIDLIKKHSGQSVVMYYDHSLNENEIYACGANKADFHVTSVSLTRDLNAELSLAQGKFIDVASVQNGDQCPQCAGALKLVRGIEVGHIFKLGTRYSEPMKLSYLDQEGKSQTVIMGTYGVGVGRALASSVEQNHDDKGIIWPLSIAPYQVNLISTDVSENIVATADKIYGELLNQRIDVLWDDRDERAGVKFNDADLIGLPLQIVIGKKGLEKGIVEYKVRATGERGEWPLADVVTCIKNWLNK